MSEIKHINIFGDPHDLGGGGTDQAVVNITRSGTTFTATRADGTTFTFTQQDLNTWQANTNTQEGYVASGSGQANKVWKTDANGSPAWRDDADTKYDSAITNITRSGTTFTATRADGTTFTFTQQDLNTWQANTASQNGYVTSGAGQSFKVWQTDTNGNPAWRDTGWQLVGTNTSVAIPSGADLNTYVTPGEYKCTYNTTASGVSNCPESGIAFRLRVEQATDTSTYLRQIWLPYNNFNVWVRVSTNSGSSWTAWRNLAADNNTWQANSKSANGYVPYGNGHNSQVWATSSSGDPSWRNSALYHNTRTTSANDKHSSITDERVTAFLATSNMTTGKPPNDAHILHFNWDNGTATTGTWDTQLALTTNNNGMYHRSQSSGTWSSWHKIYDTNNLTAQSTNHFADGLMSNEAYRALQEVYDPSGGNISWNTSVSKTDYGTELWRVGKVGFLYLNFTLSSYSAGTRILTLPRYFKPIKSMDFNIIPNAGTEHPYIRLASTGDVSLFNFTSSASQGVRALISYPIIGTDDLHSLP